MKRLIPYVKPYRVNLLFVILFGLLMSGAYFSLAPLIKELLDGAVANKDRSKLVVIPVLLIAIFVVHAVARYFHLFILKMVAERVCTQLQKDLQAKYMKLGLGYYTNADTGGMISKVISDVSIVLHGFKIMADLIREPITALGMFAYLMYLDWKLTLIVVTAGPVTVFVLNRIAKSVRKYSHMQAETMENLTSTLKETVDGIRIIQSFNLQSEMKSRLGKVVDHYLQMRKKVIARQESAGPMTETLGVCAVAALIYYIGHDLIDGNMTMGTFMAYFAALAIMQTPIKKLQDGFVRIQQPLASLERIYQVLDASEIVDEPKQAVAFPKDWDEIEFRNVSFSYGHESVLKNVDLKIRRGETIALVGESGSGKSTLVNLLARFFDPQGGKILIGGHDIKDFSLHELRRNIALVSQDVFLFNDSISQNIQSGDLDKPLDQAKVKRAAELANATSFISNTSAGFNSLAGDRGGRLSGGEKQRISIARAIYKDAPILILDEATSALDSVSELEVQKGLDQLMAGRTAFIIAHRLSTISKASRIIVMEKGNIVEQGTHEELQKKSGQYANFLKLQKVT
jgi:ATP-binding cassette subfamily B protein/subfamily B ATP-binding cassette protein MsbA